MDMTLESICEYDDRPVLNEKKGNLLSTSFASTSKAISRKSIDAVSKSQRKALTRSFAMSKNENCEEIDELIH